MTDVHDEPRRLVNADVIRMQHELAMASATRSGEPYVTVEHTLNAKGDTQTNVKVSAPMGFDSSALIDHAHRVEKIAADTYAAATSRYPRGES